MLTSQAETPKSAKSRSSSQSMKLKSGKSGSKWESELLEVCGKTLSISHPSLEPGTATSEYKISSSKIPLQDDTTLVLDGNGTVSASPSGDHTVFTAMGGHVDFRPKNLNHGKGSAELATANIVFSSPESKSLTEDVSQSDAPLIPEISAYLKTPLVISPRRGFKLELGQGEFTKRANDPNPKFKFWDTKLTYNDVPITGSFETESDQTGLHLSNPDRIWVERSNVDHMKKLPAELGDYSYLVLNETGFRLEDDTAGDELRSQSRAKIGNLGALAAQEGAARDLAAGAAAASAADARARLKAETANQAFKDKTVALNYAEIGRAHV